MQLILDHPYWTLIYAIAFIRLLYAFRPHYTRGVRLQGKWGKVYVFRLKRFPTVYKVGRTGRRTMTRQAEIQADMFGDEELELVFAVSVPFSNSVEAIAHRRLRKYRYRCAGTIECFQGDERTMISAVRKAALDVKRIGLWRISRMDREIAWQQRSGGERERLF